VIEKLNPVYAVINAPTEAELKRRTAFRRVSILICNVSRIEASYNEVASLDSKPSESCLR
jgi:hypothetical protein